MVLLPPALLTTPCRRPFPRHRGIDGPADFVTPDIPRVGALAAAITLTPALLGFAGLLTATASLIAAPNRPTQDPPSADSAT